MNIKYEKLSSELKDLIEKFHDSELINNPEITISESMNTWFENNFDKWLEEHYSEDTIEQHRQFPRIDVELPVSVVETLVDGIDHDQFGIDFIGTVTNISRGGLYFNTNKPIEKSSIIKVTIDMLAIDPKAEKVNALAMVMRVEKISEDNYGIGIMFSSIDEDKPSTLDINIFKNFAYFLYK